MIRVCSRTGRETTVHAKLFLGELRHSFYFKSTCEHAQIIQASYPCFEGFFTNSFPFTRNAISSILLLDEQCRGVISLLCLSVA